MTNFIYKNDLPNDLNLGNSIAIDTEAMGLNNHRDRLCVVQISNGDGSSSIEISSSPLISSSIMSLHKSTHSLHIYTLVPAINFFTSS